MHRRLLLFVLLAFTAITTKAHDWTYFANVSGVKYYLWVPPQALHINALILASEARISQIAGDSTIRKACTEAGIGIVGFKGGNFTSGFNAGNLPTLQAGMDALASVSKFAEVAHCPWVSYGTSVGGIFAWQVATIAPDRMLGVIEDNAVQGKDHSARTAKVPVLVSRGSNEPVGDRWFLSRDTVLALRKHGNPATLLVLAACGHFSWTKYESNYMALWLKKLVQYRITPGEVARTAPLALRDIDTAQTWLTDTTFTTPTLTGAPYSTYTGEKTNAFMHLDGELAQMWLTMHRGQFQKTPQTILTKAFPAPGCSEAFQVCADINLGMRADNQLVLRSSSTSGLPVRYGSYNGPFRIEGDTMAKMTLGNWETIGNKGWVYVIQEGNSTTQCAERVLQFRVNKKTNGTGQTVSATKLPDVNDATFPAPHAPIPFTASLTSGQPVEVFIESGAVHQVEGADQFQIEPFPRGTSMVILHYGHSGNPQFSTSNSVIDSFLITHDTLTYTVKQISSNGVRMNPNPAKAGAYAALAQGEMLREAILTDVNGRVVRTYARSDEAMPFLPYNGLCPGAYHLTLLTSKGVKHGKVVVE